jgi:hypothetical protein
MVNESGNLCVCVPGTMESCYSGPMGTDGVGLCAAGTHVCDADGLGYGLCEGEVLPAPESCLGPEDEDCSGEALACAGTFEWQKKAGDAGAQSAGGVAAWLGGAMITGSFAGSVDFGGGALTTAGGDDVFVARFDYLGAHVWSKRFGDNLAQNGRAIAVDPQGNVLVAGDFAGTIDPGGGAITSAGGTDLFLVKYAADGAFVWQQAFGGAGAQTVVWSNRFGDGAAQVGKAVAIGPTNEVVIAGDNSGTVNFGGGNLATAGSTDIVVAAFDQGGAAVWSKQFGNNGAQVANGLAIDAAGNVVLAVSFAGNVNFGGGALTTAGGNDIGLAKFTTGGMLLWGKRFGANGADNARGVAIDPFGAIVIAGDFANTVDFGGGNLVSAGNTDVVVAKFDGTGTHVWSKRAGDAGAQTASGVGTDAEGVVATGTFAGAIDFGGGAMTTAGGNDVFVVKLGQ